jgi:hypothetical protein
MHRTHDRPVASRGDDRGAVAWARRRLCNARRATEQGRMRRVNGAREHACEEGGARLHLAHVEGSSVGCKAPANNHGRSLAAHGREGEPCRQGLAHTGKLAIRKERHLRGRAHRCFLPITLDGYNTRAPEKAGQTAPCFEDWIGSMNSMSTGSDEERKRDAPGGPAPMALFRYRR